MKTRVLLPALMLAMGCRNDLGADQGQWFDTGGPQGACEVAIDVDGEVRQDGSNAELDFWVSAEGEGCQPGDGYVLEMEEYEVGEGLYNNGESGKEYVRVGEAKRYTLSCTVVDGERTGECGCDVSATGSQGQDAGSKTVAIVIR